MKNIMIRFCVKMLYRYLQNYNVCPRHTIEREEDFISPLPFLNIHLLPDARPVRNSYP